MENLVVATFKNIMDATEGLNKLKALDRSGEITIYNLLIITKKRDDHYQLLYYEGIDLARLPDDTQLAALLHNMLDQPLRLASNIFLGLFEAPNNTQEGPPHPGNGLPGNGLPGNDLLEQFNLELRLSAFSILLDAEEDNPSHLDEYLHPYQGIAWRSNITDLYHEFVEEQWLRQRTPTGTRIDSLNAAIDRITARLNARIAVLKAKINGAEGSAKDKLVSQKSRLEQKVQKLNEHMRNW